MPPKAANPFSNAPVEPSKRLEYLQRYQASFEKKVAEWKLKAADISSKDSDQVAQLQQDIAAFQSQVAENCESRRSEDAVDSGATDEAAMIAAVAALRTRSAALATLQSELSSAASWMKSFSTGKLLPRDAAISRLVSLSIVGSTVDISRIIPLNSPAHLGEIVDAEAYVQNAAENAAKPAAVPQAILDAWNNRASAKQKNNPLASLVHASIDVADAVAEESSPLSARHPSYPQTHPKSPHATPPLCVSLYRWVNQQDAELAMESSGPEPLIVLAAAELTALWANEESARSATRAAELNALQEFDSGERGAGSISGNLKLLEEQRALLLSTFPQIESDAQRQAEGNNAAFAAEVLAVCRHAEQLNACIDGEWREKLNIAMKDHADALSALERQRYHFSQTEAAAMLRQKVIVRRQLSAAESTLSTLVHLVGSLTSQLDNVSASLLPLQKQQAALDKREQALQAPCVVSESTTQPLSNGSSTSLPTETSLTPRGETVKNDATSLDIDTVLECLGGGPGGVSLDDTIALLPEPGSDLLSTPFLAAIIAPLEAFLSRSQQSSLPTQPVNTPPKTCPSISTSHPASTSVSDVERFSLHKMRSLRVQQEMTPPSSLPRPPSPALKEDPAEVAAAVEELAAVSAALATAYRLPPAENAHENVSLCPTDHNTADIASFQHCDNRLGGTDEFSEEDMVDPVEGLLHGAEAVRQRCITQSHDLQRQVEALLHDLRQAEADASVVEGQTALLKREIRDLEGAIQHAHDTDPGHGAASLAIRDAVVALFSSSCSAVQRKHLTGLLGSYLRTPLQ